MIQQWLRGVEGTAGTDSTHSPSPHKSPLAAAHQQEADFLGSLDWGHGSVVDNARSVMEGLLRKDFPSVRHPYSNASLSTQQSHDPRVTMEMRHKKVCFVFSAVNLLI